MANQNKDDTKPISSGLQPGPTEHLAGTATTTASTTSTSANTMGATRTATGNSGTKGMSAMASEASQTVKQSSARIADEAKHYAGDMANIAKEKSRTLFEQQKESAVGQVGSFANALRNTSGQLQGEGQDQIGRYIEMAADKLEAFGNQLRQKDLDTLISDTQNLARRSPGVFFAGTVVAGLLLSRFLKSSAQRQYESAAMSDEEWRADTASQAGTFTNQPDMTTVSGSGVSGTASTSASMDSTLDATSVALNPSGAAGTSLGATTGTGTSSSSLNESSTGGNPYGNR